MRIGSKEEGKYRKLEERKRVEREGGGIQKLIMRGRKREREREGEKGIKGERERGNYLE